MKRFLSRLVFLAALAWSAAPVATVTVVAVAVMAAPAAEAQVTGDITNVTILPDGWSALITVRGFTNGATLNFGYTTNTYGVVNVPTASTPYFSVTSISSDDTPGNEGAATTIERSIFIEKVTRWPYSTNSIAGSYTSGTFSDGELVTQGTTNAQGFAVCDQSTGSLLYLRSVAGMPDNSHTWTGVSGVFTPTGTPTVLTLPTDHQRVTAPGGTSSLTFRVALAAYVFSKDNSGGGNSGVACTFNAPAGFVTNTGGAGQTSNSVTMGAVTNSSTAAYTSVKVISNWSRTSYEKVGTTMTIGCEAFQHHGRLGRPIRVVVFSVTDGSTTVSRAVTKPAIDGTFGDWQPCVEYLADISTASFNQGAVLTANYVAYAWVGGPDTKMDTSTGTAPPTGLWGPRKYVCDKDGTYCTSAVVVDPAAADDTHGAVTGSFNSGSPPAAYKTLAGAKNALRTYNSSTYSRANAGGSMIYMQGGNYDFMGATVTADSTTPDAVLTMTPFPGVARSSVVINATSGTKTAGLRVKLKGITWTAQSASGVLDPNSSSAYVTLEDCEINCPTANQPPFYRIGVINYVRCLITSLDMGIRPYSTTYMVPALCRGNNIVSINKENVSLVCIGNKGMVGNSDSIAGTTMQSGWDQNHIFAFNKATWALSSVSILNWGMSSSNTFGCAAVQNFIENTADTSVPLIQFCADNSTNDFTNLICWNNAFIGQRYNGGYSEQSPNTVKFWSLKNNIFGDYNIKSDTFSNANRTVTDANITSGSTTMTSASAVFVAGDVGQQVTFDGVTGGYTTIASRTNGTTVTLSAAATVTQNNNSVKVFIRNYGQSGYRTNNWPVLYGTGCSGNIWAENIAAAASGSFLNEFAGLHSYQPALSGSQPPNGTANAADFLKFVNDLSYHASGSPTAGGTDAHLTSTSPARRVQRDLLLPYDLDGKARGVNDAAGVYRYGTAGPKLFIPLGL